MPKVRTLLDHCFFAGQYNRAGDEVDVSKEELEILLALGNRVEEIKVPRKRRTKDEIEADNAED